MAPVPRSRSIPRGTIVTVKKRRKVPLLGRLPGVITDVAEVVESVVNAGKLLLPKK